MQGTKNPTDRGGGGGAEASDQLESRVSFRDSRAFGLLQIVVTPSGGRKWRASFGARTLCTSASPFVTASRILMAECFGPDCVIEMWHARRHHLGATRPSRRGRPASGSRREGQAPEGHAFGEKRGAGSSVASRPLHRPRGSDERGAPEAAEPSRQRADRVHLQLVEGYVATVSFLPDGRLTEIFINNAKAGSHSGSAGRRIPQLSVRSRSNWACRSTSSGAGCCVDLARRCLFLRSASRSTSWPNKSGHRERRAST